MWYGTRANIPDGWVECDGSNGTPDMRLRFAYGGSASYPPLSTGGTWTHAHNLSMNTDTHNHVANAEIETDSLDTGNYVSNVSPAGDLHRDTVGHEHVVTVENDAHAHVGVTNSREHTSPFVSLLFIMKL